MNIDEKIQLIEEGTLEVIDTEELKEVLEKEQPIAYTGYEPSGKIHLGHAVTVQKLKQLQKLGFKIKILLADYHAFLNGKGTIEEIAETAEYNKLHGLDGDAKMSSSKGNYIAVDDSVETINKKIKKSFCPQGEVEGNPMIEIAETFVFPNQDTLLIKRPEKFGGDIELTHDELIKDFSEGNLHPMDLKNGIKDFLIEFFAPVREFMEEN